MFNTKNLAIIILALCSLMVAFSGSHATSASGGYTSAPGDGVCAQCHTDNNTSLDGDYTVTGIPQEIEPNTTYTVSIQLTNPSGNASRGGFQILALNENNTQGGTWSNASEGSVFKTVAGKTYLGHQGSQSFPDDNQLNWSAEWTSPLEDNATYQFYAVSIIANGANGNQNDRFLLQQFEASTSNIVTPLTVTTDLISNATCANTSDGSAIVNISGGVEPYEILWENGETTETSTMQPVGNTFVTVTDATGLSVEATIDIGFSTTLEIQTDYLASVMCFGTNSGAVTVSAPNGIAPIKYQWSNGATENNIDNLESGIYTVTATDANGCESSVNFTIIELEKINIEVDLISNNSCIEDSIGSLQAIATGGSPDYMYLWNNGDNQSITDSLINGVYTVTVVDANGCTSVSSQSSISSLDIVPPSLVLKDLIIYAHTDGFDEIDAALFDNGSTDNCSEINFEYISNPMIGCEFIGTQVISVIGSDTLNNRDTMEVSLTLVDTIAPILISGQLDVVELEGCLPFIFDFPVFTDNCSDSLIIEQLEGFTSGEVFPVGNTEQVYSISDMHGNQTMYSFTVQVTSDLDANVEVLNSPCFGEPEGMISVEVSGSHAPYILDSTLIQTGVFAGSYLVNILDTLGCQIIQIANVLEPSEIESQVIVTPATTSNTSDGMIAVNAEGGTPPYSISLFDDLGQEIAMSDEGIFTNLPSSLYSAVVLDSNECEINVEDIDVTFLTNTLDLFDIYDIQSYPNPVSDQLVIAINALPPHLSLSIKTMDGKLVWSDIGKVGFTSIDLSDQPPGLYLLTLTDKESTTTRKISLQH